MGRDFFDTWKAATEETCKAPWSGGKNGKYFRCNFCGHKFGVGDLYMLLYTNSTPGAGGNPMTCKDCFDCYGSKDAAVEEWRKRLQEVKTKYWWAIVE